MLFSHRPGEKFVYGGGLFTVIVLSNSLVMGCVHQGVNGPALDRMRELFLAVDQFGVVNIFTHDEEVVTVNSIPMFGNTYKDLPNGVEDAKKVLCTGGFGRREQEVYDTRHKG
jgi:hypothetical protein